MIKQLLSLAAISGLALSAAASVPCPIKHNNCWNKNEETPYADGNGFHYEPSGSGSAAESLEGLEITCTAGNGSALFDTNSGFQFQTASIKPSTDELKVTKDHVIVAVDYKTNVGCPSGFWTYFIYNGDFSNDMFYNQGQITTVSDEWQTMYVYAPLKNDALANNGAYGRPDDWGIFADESHTASDYLWLRFDTNYMTYANHPEFTITVKNSRMLTIAEMETELAAKTLKGDQAIYIDTQLPNTDITADKDGDKNYFTYTGDNGLINLTNPMVRLYSQNRIFKMEYQVAYEDAATTQGVVGVLPMKSINVYAGYALDGGAGVVILESKYELDNDDDAWGEVSFDFTGALSDAYTSSPISTQGLWLQFNNASMGTPKNMMFSLRNARWTSANSGIENVAADAANGAVTYYNLQGVQVTNPTNGLYIKKQGNTTSKVLVK